MERKINYFILFILFYFIGASYSLICKFGKKVFPRDTILMSENEKNFLHFCIHAHPCINYRFSIYVGRLRGLSTKSPGSPGMILLPQCKPRHSCDESKILRYKYRELPSPPHGQAPWQAVSKLRSIQYSDTPPPLFRTGPDLISQYWCRNFRICYTVKNAVELFFAFHPDVEKIQYH